ncbi:hypothetical protein QCA50_013449 [Cerrena zonata]|uniref:Fatty acid desaturase domain-containing protein n=1 Tax=Cerrena zonata TaxID=2478898 RepID=A0AAW0G1U9_9APHY
MFQLFADSPEYEARRKRDFAPPKITISEIHAAVPQHLFEKSTSRALYYVLRDVLFSVAFYQAATHIDPVARMLASHGIRRFAVHTLRWSMWCLYWWWESITLAGWWCLGHEAGHGTLSPYKWVNNTIGYILHTFLLVPYFSWRSTHHAHHKATNSVERDENYVPRTRTDCGLPPASRAQPLDYHEVFEETPIYTLVRMIAMQLLGWQSYLLGNTLGSPMYPPGTNHFWPSSPLFKPDERDSVIMSNIGLGTMMFFLGTYIHVAGLGSFVKYYFVPYLLANHWIVMLTFLHHSDPTTPHYRNKEWTWLRGAIATVDRPLLGGLGRFFLHNVSHDHIAHHIFSNIPFYNQPQVTEILKDLLKEDYNYDSTNSFRALYRSFTQCCFIEDEGDIVFYKNRDGITQRVLKTD